MKKTSVRVAASVASVVAVVVVAVGVYLASSGGTMSNPTRPVRALGAGIDADLDLAARLTDGEAAKPVAGATARPNLSKPLSKITSSGLSVVPWVKKELTRDAKEGEEEGESEESKLDAASISGVDDQADGALQTERGGSKIPAPILNVNGQNSNGNPYNVVPPDTNGDVGNGYYVQMVNVTFAVYDADTGAKVEGPALMSDLYGSGADQKLCRKHDDGDPVVVFDEFAERWVITQFALNFNTNKYAECIAVSTTDDPTGSWNAYQFDYPNPGTFNDYPKFGVWQDGYYASYNQFDGQTFGWRGGGAVAYERDAMLVGDPARQVYVDLYDVRNDLGGMLPSDADGDTLPPGGTPNYFLMFDADEPGWGYPDDQIEVWEFHADFDTPANSTFTQQGVLPTANFNPWICGKGKVECVPQKKSPTKLDTLLDRLMYRLQYRNFGGGDQRMVVTHSVRAAAGVAGVRWYEFKNNGPGGDWAIAQQSTYAPDTKKSRWMGSAAMDQDGNIALGYSLSSKGIYPSIAIAGRLDGAPENMLGQAERKVFKGLGSEAPSKNTDYARWGDYSDLTVDNRDGCTFFYTTQYYKKTGQWKWGTRIVSFELPGCGI